MLPAIAKVVEVREAAGAGLDESVQAHAPFIEHRFGTGPFLVRDAVMQAPHYVLVQMTSVPAHGLLQDRAEFGEGHALRHQQLAPHQRLDFLQLDAQLVIERSELFYAARDSTRGSRRATRHGSSSSMRLIG